MEVEDGAYGDSDFAEHRDTLPNIRERDVLRRRHDDGPCPPARGGARRQKGGCESGPRGDVPSTATSWPSVSGTSPVPGGMSTTSTSSPGPDPGPDPDPDASACAPTRQSTSNSSCWTAFCTMRPRQTTGVSALEPALELEPGAGVDFGRRKPMDMHGMPWFVSGTRAPAVRACVRACVRAFARDVGWSVGAGAREEGKRGGGNAHRV